MTCCCCLCKSSVRPHYRIFKDVGQGPWFRPQHTDKPTLNHHVSGFWPHHQLPHCSALNGKVVGCRSWVSRRFQRSTLIVAIPKQVILRLLPLLRHICLVSSYQCMSCTIVCIHMCSMVTAILRLNYVESLATSSDIPNKKLISTKMPKEWSDDWWSLTLSESFCPDPTGGIRPRLRSWWPSSSWSFCFSKFHQSESMAALQRVVAKLLL